MQNEIELRQGVLYVALEMLLKMGIPLNTIRDGIYNGGKSWRGNLKTGIEYEPLLRKYKDKLHNYFCNDAQYTGDIYAYAAHLVAKRAAQKIHYEKVIEQQTQAEKFETLLGRLRTANSKYAAAVEWYAKQLPTAEVYAHADAYLLLEWLSGQVEPRGLGFRSLDALYNWIAKEVKTRCKAALGCVSVIRKKLATFQIGDYAAVLSAKRGNANAKKINEEGESYLKELLKNNQSSAVITRLYNRAAAAAGWQMVGTRTVELRLRKIWTEVLAARNGYDAFNKHVTPVRQFARPTKADVLWVSDGTPTDIRVLREVVAHDENGKWTRTIDQWARVYLYIVVDAATWEVVGYALGKTERAELVQAAYGMALRKYSRAPLEVMHDGGSAHEALRDMFDRMSKHNITTQPDSPNAKVVEAVLGKFKQQFERFVRGWTGMGIKSRTLLSQANLDKKEVVMTEAQLLQELPMMFECWNRESEPTNERSNWEAPHALRAKLGSAGRVCTEEEIFDMMSFVRATATKYTRKGLRVANNYYMAADAATHLALLNGRAKYCARIDLAATEFITLYDEKGQPVRHDDEHVMLVEASVLQAGRYDATPDSDAKLREHTALKKSVREIGKQQIREISLAELDWRTVHKDALNEVETLAKITLYGSEQPPLQGVGSSPVADLDLDELFLEKRIKKNRSI